MMHVAPETLLMSFSLAEVASMVIAFEDATMGTDEHATPAREMDAVTVRAPASKDA